MPTSNRARSLLPFSAFLFIVFAQVDASASNQHSYADSSAGLQEQLSSILVAARSHDDAVFRSALDSLKLPNEWLTANFDPHLVKQVSREYDQALKRYQEHISWVMEKFAAFDDFTVNVQALEPPARVSPSPGKFVAPINAIKVEPFRMSSGSADPGHGPPSWVSSFVYVDGEFRYVGGTYTFWDEGLDGLRGPVSMPVETIHGRSVQGIAGRNDAIEIGPGVDAIVELTVRRDATGDVHTSVKEGDSPYLEDAEEYLKAQNYGIPSNSDSPNTPLVARTMKIGDPGMTTIWGMEVVFWSGDPGLEKGLGEEVARFVDADMMQMPPACEVLFVGSSSIVKWKDTLAADMAPMPVINRGFGGSHIEYVNEWFDQLVAPYRPRTIVFYAGENDLDAHKPVERVVGDFGEFMKKKTQALGDTPVYFISVKPSKLRFGQLALQKQVNQEIRARAEKRADLHYIDVVPAMLGDNGKPKDIFGPDGLHMNRAGYEIWTRAVRAAVLPHSEEDKKNCRARALGAKASTP